MVHTNTKQHRSQVKCSQVLETYPYVMADGSPGYFKDRKADGTFSVWHTDHRGRRRSGKGPNDPVLYNLPAVIAAVADGCPIYQCEGEKDSNALIARGYVATTAGGAGYWPPEATELLRGAIVHGVLDDDLAGHRHGRLVEKRLRGAVSSLDFLLPAAGKDAHDHLVTHGLGMDGFRPVLVGDLLSPPPPRTPRSTPMTTTPSTMGGHALAEWVRREKLQELAATPLGERNTTLNAISYYLLRLAHGGMYDHSALLADLEGTARSIDLKPWEIRATLRSASRAAAKTPRAFTDTNWRTNDEDAFVASVDAAIASITWPGKGGQYRRRIVLATIEVLKLHHFSPHDFPASTRDIAKYAGARHLPSVRTALVWLVQAGWLIRVRKGDRDGKASRWSLTIPGTVSSPSSLSSGSHSFPGMHCGSYSECLPISDAAFFPSCWGFAAHQVLPHLSLDESRSGAELARPARVSPSTARRALRRLNETGVVTRSSGGWRLATAAIRSAAQMAAQESGAAVEQRILRKRFEAQQRSYRAATPLRRAPSMTAHRRFGATTTRMRCLLSCITRRAQRRDLIMTLSTSWSPRLHEGPHANSPIRATGERFLRIPLWIIETDISPNAKLLYGVLTIFVDYDDITTPVYPSEDTLAKLLGLKPRRVYDLVRELEGIGAIKVVRKGRRNGPGWPGNLYYLLPEPTSVHDDDEPGPSIHDGNNLLVCEEGSRVDAGSPLLISSAVSDRQYRQEAADESELFQTSIQNPLSAEGEWDLPGGEAERAKYLVQRAYDEAEPRPLTPQKKLIPLAEKAVTAGHHDDDIVWAVQNIQVPTETNMDMLLKRARAARETAAWAEVEAPALLDHDLLVQAGHWANRDSREAEIRRGWIHPALRRLGDVATGSLLLQAAWQRDDASLRRVEGYWREVKRQHDTHVHELGLDRAHAEQQSQREKAECTLELLDAVAEKLNEWLDVNPGNSELCTIQKFPFDLRRRELLEWERRHGGEPKLIAPQPEEPAFDDPVDEAAFRLWLRKREVVLLPGDPLYGRDVMSLTHEELDDIASRTCEVTV